MTAAQKKARENFTKAIEYRKKTGCSLKEAFAHVKGGKVGSAKKDHTALDILNYRSKVGDKKFKKLTPKQRVTNATKKTAKKRSKVSGYTGTIRNGNRTNVTYTNHSRVSEKKGGVVKKIGSTKKTPGEFVSLSGYSPTKEIVLGSIGKLKTIEKLIPEVKLRITRGKSVINENIKGVEDTARIFKKFIGRDKVQTQEFFAVMYLAQNLKVLGVYIHSMGTINSTSADIRLILAGALRIGAVNMIVCHNHPSGNLTPSGADLSLTKKLETAAAYHDIKIIDHVIISKDGYYSFLEHGNIKN